MEEWELNRLIKDKEIKIMRKFYLENVGNLPVFIKKYSIDNKHCNLHGFSILNCQETKVDIGEMKELKVTF